MATLLEQIASAALPITIDPDILGGTPVFRGTRVPIKTLFDYLRWNYTIDGFLEYFPTVSREAAEAVLAEAERATLQRAEVC